MPSKEELLKWKRAALFDLKLNVFFIGWSVALALWFLAGLAGGGPMWYVLGFALNAAVAGYSYRQVFGDPGTNKVQFRISVRDRDGKEIHNEIL